MGEAVTQSTLREDIWAALHKERNRIDACHEAATNAAKLNYEARHTLLTEYIDLLEDEDACVILEVKSEYPQNGRIRL